MRRKRHSTKGNILLVVVCVFAVILIMGTALLRTVSMSHKYSIRQKEKQQAYYAAKSVLDSLLVHITTKSLAEQNSLINKLHKQESEEILFKDDQGKEWRCYIEVEKGADLVKITSRAKDSQGIQGQIVGELKKETNADRSSIISHKSITIDSTQSIEMVEITTATGEGNIDINTVGDLSLDKVNAPQGWVKLKASGSLSVGDIFAGKERMNEDKEKIAVEIFVGQTGVFTHGIIKGNTVKIHYFADNPPVINSDKIYTSNGKFKLEDDKKNSIEKTCKIGELSMSIPDKAEEKPQVELHDKIGSDITFYYKEDGTLMAQWIENKKLVEIPISSESEKPNVQYKFLMKSNSDVYFGYKRLGTAEDVTDKNGSGKDVDDTLAEPRSINTGNKRYNISIGDSGNNGVNPTGIYFKDVTNTQFFGNFYSQVDGFNIYGETEGLVFGSITYVFKRYMKE